MTMASNPGFDKINTRLDDIESEIEKLQLENVSLEEQIKVFLKVKNKLCDEPRGKVQS